MLGFFIIAIVLIVLAIVLPLTKGNPRQKIPRPVISGILAIIIMTDAMAVRLESGRHSRFLNRMIDEGREAAPEDGKRFQTLLGHTFAQVAVGFAIGVVCALLLSLVPFPALK